MATDLPGSKIQIMNGAGTNLFPRNRTIDIVDKAGNAVFNASTQQISAAYLPSYVDDVLEVEYLGSGTLPTFASASHANKWMFSTSNNKMYSGSTTAWVQKDWETGKIYIDINGDNVEGTYRWTGTKPVKITEAPIATTDNVRPWTAAGTAESSFVPTELAVATAINSGVTSAVAKAKSDIGKVVNTIAANSPVGRNVASGNVTLSLNYGTNSTYGVYLDLANTTSLVAKGKLATGASNGYGTVAALSTVSTVPVVSDFSTVFYLSGYVSGANTSAMASTYLVPSIKLLHDVMSTAQDQYKVAVSSVTQTGSTMTFTRLDGTTFQHIVTSAQYAAYTTTATGANNANNLGGTAAATIKKAFSSVTQTGTSLVFTGIDGTTKVSHVVTSAVYAVDAGDATKLGGKTEGQLFVSSAAVAGNAGTANNANSLGGTAAGTIKKAFSSVTQTGTSMVFKALDGTLTSHVVSSAVYAVTAGNGGVKSLTSKTDGLKLNATTGAIEISGVAMTSANASTAGKMGMVPAPAKGDQVKFLRGDGTWAVPANTTYGAATVTSQGLVKLTDTSAALQYGATGTTVLTQAELNRSIKTYLVTSIFDTSANAVAGITNSMNSGHSNEYVAANTGEIYQVISTGATTVSAKLIVGAGDQHLLIKTDNNTVSGNNARLLAFVSAADSAGTAGNAAKLGGLTSNQLLVSSAVSAGTAGTAAKLGTKTENQLLVSSAASAGTANNANNLGGTAAATIKKAFSSVTQTGTSLVFTGIDGTTKVSHVVTSAVYAKTAGGVVWSDVTGKPTIVNTVKGMNGVGISGNVSTGNVVVSGINATDAVAGVVQLAGGRLTSNNATAGKDVITQSRLDVERIIHEVTSLFATDASATTAAGTAGSGHAGHFFAGNTKLYKVVMKDATTTSAQEVGALGGLPFVLSNAVASQNGNLYVSRGGQYRPVVTSINQGSNVTVVNNNDGTFTISAKDTTYAAATLAEILASSGINKFMRPDSYGAAQLGTLTTGATTTNAALAATTSKGYVPTAYAVLNQCLFYSTIA